MKKYISLVVLVFCCVLSQAQTEKVDEPIVIEELLGEECHKNLMRLEGYLYKPDLNKPNTSEFLNYGLKLSKVEKVYPYLVKEGPDGKYIAYEQIIPMLLEALEESNNLLNNETGHRLKLEEDYENYKIHVENNLQQMNYQIQVLQSEIEGINESKSVD